MNLDSLWPRRAVPVLVTLLTLAGALAGGAKPAFAGSDLPVSPAINAERLASTSTCPQRHDGLKVDHHVAADFSNSGNLTRYKFFSLINERPADGVPGLVEYCVYPDDSIQKPTAIRVRATGADGSPWVAVLGHNNFAFSRKLHNRNNIPLDGNPTLMGDVLWRGMAPKYQTIVLHINDPKVCADIYGQKGYYSCFVKPKPKREHCVGVVVHGQCVPLFAIVGGEKPPQPPQPPGTVCDQGLTSVAYNDMPFGVIHCGPPALGFEATATSEFGDRVDLAAGVGRGLTQLQVDFQSYGCSVSGHWNTGDCVSTPGATFTHPITANIYAVDNTGPTPKPGPLLATVTQTQTIPYRPSADNTNCTGTNAGKWFDPLAPNGGACRNSIGVVLTFNFSGKTLPNEVIWTVAFNTTHYGYNPIGQGAACFSSPGGCGYDSLNVGTMTFPNAPYAGKWPNPGEAFLNSASGASYCDGGAGGTGTLRQDAPCWAGFKPLGMIVTQ